MVPSIHPTLLWTCGAPPRAKKKGPNMEMDSDMPSGTGWFKNSIDHNPSICICAVLIQEDHLGELVIAFTSHLLHGTKRSYSVLEKESLSVVWAVEKRCPYKSLYCRHWPRSLDIGLQPTKHQIAPSVDFNVRYRKGQSNVVPNALSHQKEGDTPPALLNVISSLVVYPMSWRNKQKWTVKFQEGDLVWILVCLWHPNDQASSTVERTSENTYF